MKNRTARIVLGSLLGGILGVFIVWAFFLDAIDRIGWSIFWSGLFHGEVTDWSAVVHSAAFLKCLAGFLVLGAATGITIYFKDKR